MVRLAAWVLAPAPPGAGSQEGLPAAGEIRRNLEGILSSPEYDTGEGDRALNFWQWLVQKLQDFMESLGGLATTAPVLFWLLLIGCVIALALIFLHAGVVLFRALHAARSAAPAAGDGAGSLSVDPRELLARAREEAAASRFAAAIRVCHRASLLGLDRRGLVRFEESLTTGDYARQLRGRPPECARFESLARLFEPAFFGRVPVGAKEASECLRLAGLFVGESAP